MRTKSYIKVYIYIHLKIIIVIDIYLLNKKLKLLQTPIDPVHNPILQWVPSILLGG